MSSTRPRTHRASARVPLLDPNPSPSSVRVVRVAVALGVAAAAAWTGGCGSSTGGYAPSMDGGSPDAGVDATTPGDGGGSSDASEETPSFGNDTGTAGSDVKAITIMPNPATLVAQDGTSATIQFQVVAQYANGTTGPLNGAPNWSASAPAIGHIDATGTFTAKGNLGGAVAVTAAYGSLTATAPLSVSLLYVENPAHLSTAVQSSLQGATTPDPTVKWAYPYDGTTFPRGINESTLMWIGGAVTDDYYVHVKSPTFELQSFATAPIQQWDFTTSGWAQFLDSTSGTAEIQVARWDGTQATTIVDEHVSVANGSIRGTVYYAAYYLNGATEIGKVLRIKPGATSYDDFLDAGTTCTSCHTVSANGSTMVLNWGNWPPETSQTWDLQSGNAQPVFSGFVNGNADAGASEWAVAALSANGAALIENFAPLRGPIGAQTGALDPFDGGVLAGSGITQPMWMPAFSPDDRLIAYVEPTTSDLRAMDWDPASQSASNDRLVVASASNSAAPQIQYPTISPDHMWIVYQRGPALGSLGVPGDLYVASVTNPGAEIQLAALDGASYPFAAGSRDRDLDYEPTFAPVAAGGYFWLAFHSRRTYGTKVTGPPYLQPGAGVKQLWVAAFDQAPAAGVDPSHPAFYLGGQSTSALNTRGYFALAPCAPDGQSCQTGTDCCGGYCDGVPDGGTSDGGLVCGQASGGCSQDGDKCTKAADCCNVATGTVCINDVCSEPPPSQ
ncbi:MAG TPA: hypothetical protein VGG39_22325 [Polyangiaceae bacterium]|jgi:hypothetical protein